MSVTDSHRPVLDALIAAGADVDEARLRVGGGEREGRAVRFMSVFLADVLVACSRCVCGVR